MASKQASPIGLTTGNAALKPEKADSWNIGAVFTPRFVPGFTMSVDYFRIDLKDAIDTITAQEIVNRCDEGRLDYCAAITEDPTRTIPATGGLPKVPYWIIRNQPFNFAKKLVRGIDFDAAYRLPVGGESAITLKGTATRYIENVSDTGIPGVTPVNTVGANGGQFSTPTWIFRGSLNYETPRFSGTVTGRGVSAGKYLANAIECASNCPASTLQFPTYDNNRVSGLFYVDTRLTDDFNTGSDLFPQKEQTSYVVVNGRVGIRGKDERWALEFWAQNLFNEKYAQVAFNSPFQQGGSTTPPYAAGFTAMPFADPQFPGGRQMFSQFLAEPRTYGITGRIKF